MSEIRSIRQTVVTPQQQRSRRAPAVQSSADRYTPSAPSERFPTRAEMQALVRGPNEAQEREILGGRNQPGRLVPLMQGRNGAVVTIHGVNSAPEAVNSLAEPGVRSGQEVHTFAYDDRFRRLGDSSRDLAGQLGEWMERNPGKPLTLRAHSMGGRVTLGALGLLQEEGRLEGRRINLDLVAPPLGGYGAANWARADFTGVLGGVVPVLRPGRDMGTSSGFQEQLESLRLPANVRTRIFVGGRDEVVNPNLDGFQRIQQNLRAQVIHLPEADHNTILQQLP
jgi:pimeloyl-ACP methyl ester carboxylesterase